MEGAGDRRAKARLESVNLTGKRPRRWLRRIVAAGVATVVCTASLAAGGVYAANHFTVNVIGKPQTLTQVWADTGREPVQCGTVQNTTQLRDRAVCATANEIASDPTPITLATGDGQTLHGWFYRSDAPAAQSDSSRKLVIFFHGYHGNRDMDWISWIGQKMNRQGFDVLTMDRTGCGDSTGIKDTLDWHDAWAEFQLAEKMGYNPKRIVLMGFSGGGDVIDAALGQEPEMRQVAAVINDSAPASIGQLTRDDFHPQGWLAWTRTPASVLLQGAANLIGLGPSANAVQGLATYKGPVLIIQGDADQIASVQGARELFATSKNPQSELLIVPGASHVWSVPTDPKLYFSTLIPFAENAVE